MGCLVITGASRGLGSQIAEKSLAAGDTVIGLSRSPLENWEVKPNPNFIGYQCDISDESNVKRVFSEIRKTQKNIDALVNNAGMFSAQLLQMASGDHFRDVLNNNLVSTMLVTREAAKMMRPRNFGRVVTITSIASKVQIPGNAFYGISKEGSEQLMRNFAVEFRETGITFNCLGVSFIEETGMLTALTDSSRKKYESRLLEPANISPDEVMHALSFLRSEMAGSITGQVIYLGSPE